MRNLLPIIFVAGLLIPLKGQVSNEKSRRVVIDRMLTAEDFLPYGKSYKRTLRPDKITNPFGLRSSSPPTSPLPDQRERLTDADVIKLLSSAGIQGVALDSRGNGKRAIIGDAIIAIGEVVGVEISGEFQALTNLATITLRAVSNNFITVEVSTSGQESRTVVFRYDSSIKAN